MDTFELKREQLKLAPKIELRDDFTIVKTIGGAECIAIGNKILASVVVCEFPSLKLLEHKTYLLSDAFPYVQGFSAYREMPALIEAYNQLEQEPDVLMVKGEGILHLRRFGLASHLGLALNIATIGVQESLLLGKVEKGKIFLHNELAGFEVITRAHACPLYVSPGHLISLGSVLRLMKETLRYPHKMPEPLHLAHKLGKKILSLRSELASRQELKEITNVKGIPNFQTEKEVNALSEETFAFVENKLEGVKESGG